MFGFIKDVVGSVASVAGAITGSVLGLSVGLISATLGITETMVREATNAGCKTYEEIKDFHKLN